MTAVPSVLTVINSPCTNSSSGIGKNFLLQIFIHYNTATALTSIFRVVFSPCGLSYLAFIIKWIMPPFWSTNLFHLSAGVQQWIGNWFSSRSKRRMNRCHSTQLNKNIKTKICTWRLCQGNCTCKQDSICLQDKAHTCVHWTHECTCIKKKGGGSNSRQNHVPCKWDHVDEAENKVIKQLITEIQKMQCIPKDSNRDL